MFEELFEKTKKASKQVDKVDLEKLKPLVRKQLKKDFTGDRLEDAVDAVAEGILRNYPDILTDEDFFSAAGKFVDKEGREGWEEFVFDAASREGY